MGEDEAIGVGLMAVESGRVMSAAVHALVTPTNVVITAVRKTFCIIDGWSG